MDYTFEDTPMPPPRRKTPRYPWYEVEVDGPALVLPGAVANCVRSAANQWVKRNRPDCTARVQQKGTDVRVWFYTSAP